MAPFRNRADARELPSRWKVQVLDAGVDDISERRPQIICNHFDHVCRDVIRTR